MPRPTVSSSRQATLFSCRNASCRNDPALHFGNSILLRSRGNFSVLRFVTIDIMKTSNYLLVTLLGVMPALALSAAETRTVARADVMFFEPLKFTDVRDSYMGDHERTTYLESIRDHL